MGDGLPYPQLQNLGFNAHLSLIWISLSVSELGDSYFIYECKQNFKNSESSLFLVSMGSDELRLELKCECPNCVQTVCCCFTLGSVLASSSVWEADLCWTCLVHFLTLDVPAGAGRAGDVVPHTLSCVPLFWSVAQAGLSMAKFSFAVLPKLSSQRSLANSLALFGP